MVGIMLWMYASDDLLQGYRIYLELEAEGQISIRKYTGGTFVILATEELPQMVDFGETYDLRVHIERYSGGFRIWGVFEGVEVIDVTDPAPFSTGIEAIQGPVGSEPTECEFFVVYLRDDVPRRIQGA